ncbi:AP2-like ethylene-responsive transcription factor SNZ [Hondaea fermentalgiana]|uniref:AP2-like ethylene-responsive transcription factor SNZ n=1 Tax=Hondaea fermentalgiana TaxID=2315210 RepID=A0A2R5GAL7_9STRA|nr:AP2-like ethylene-responsive transcription factor SNZ [Hondaea fermentalgiana]|eukprot:GBG27349.1 AP2-like ethylene-responsive transcription factor SNZ [Hondaea fermentalgiana]
MLPAQSEDACRGAVAPTASNQSVGLEQLASDSALAQELRNDKRHPSDSHAHPSHHQQELEAQSQNQRLIAVPCENRRLSLQAAGSSHVTRGDAHVKSGISRDFGAGNESVRESEAFLSQQMTIPEDALARNPRPVFPSPFDQKRVAEACETGKVVSKYRGVYWNATCKAWRARIWFQLRSEHLGNFDDEIEAARAFDKRALELGRMKDMNFPFESPAVEFLTRRKDPRQFTVEPEHMDTTDAQG